jgi:integrase
MCAASRPGASIRSSRAWGCGSAVRTSHGSALGSSIGRPQATPYFLRHTYASLRLAEQRLSLQEIAEEMGHTVEVLARTYAHVISEYRGRGPIAPDALITRARRREAPQNAPSPTTNSWNS